MGRPIELAVLLIQVLVVVGLSRLLAPVARRLGQPLVLAEIVAGIALGPSLLGWVAPDASDLLFPESSLDGLRLLGQLGVLLFMFLVGLELDPKLLRGRTHVSVAVSIASIATPFLLALLVAQPLYAHYGSEAPPLSFALFFAAAVSVTAFPVLARILSEHSLLTTRVGALAIACAAVDDVVAWAMITLLASVSRENGWLDAARVTAVAGALVVGLLIVVRPWAVRAVRRIERRGDVGSSALIAVLLPLLLVVALSEMLGLHAFFAAFLFGAALPKDGALADVLHEKLEAVTSGLLLPLFFAHVGLSTNLGHIDQLDDWLTLGGLLLLAVFGKLGSSAIAGRLAGLGWRESGTLGVLLNTRGLMGLIVLKVGLDLGILSPTFFSMMIVVAVLTTLMTSPLLKLAYPHPATIAARFAERSDAPSDVSTPAQQPPEVIVACISDDRTSRALASVVSALSVGADREVRVFGLHLDEPSSRASDNGSAAVRAQSLGTGAMSQSLGTGAMSQSPGTGAMSQSPGTTPLARFLEYARGVAVEARPLAFVSANPADDIVRIAEAKRAAIVLLGGRDPDPLVGRLGGIVAEVLENARTTVAVLVTDDDGFALDRFRRVLVGDGGPEDACALSLARRIAANTSMPLEIVRTEDRGASRTLLDAAAPDGRDLLVVGTAERWQLDRDLPLDSGGLLGSVRTPVLVVHDGRPAVFTVPATKQVSA